MTTCEHGADGPPGEQTRRTTDGASQSHDHGSQPLAQGLAPSSLAWPGKERKAVTDNRLNHRDVYQIVTDRLLAALEKGTVPWHQPWRSQLPANLVTRKTYRGVNILVLGCMPFASPWWATYRQIEALGGHVRKGEHGSPVCFWKWPDRTDEEEETQDQVRHIPLLRHYTVFNSEQCQRIEHHLPVGQRSPAEPIAAAEAIVAGMPNPPRIQHRTLRAAITQPLTWWPFHPCRSGASGLSRKSSTSKKGLESSLKTFASMEFPLSGCPVWSGAVQS